MIHYRKRLPGIGVEHKLTKWLIRGYDKKKKKICVEWLKGPEVTRDRARPGASTGHSICDLSPEAPTLRPHAHTLPNLTSVTKTFSPCPFHQI